MHNKNIFFGMFSLSLLAFSTFVVGCYFPPVESKGAVIIHLNSGSTSRTLSPSVNFNVTEYSILANGPGGARISIPSIIENECTIEEIALGSWEFLVIGKNSSGEAITEATKAITVVAGIRTTVQIICTPVVGDGELSLSLEWPENTLTKPRIIAELIPDSDVSHAIALNFIVGSTKATFSSISVLSGYYTLSLCLMEEGILDPVWSWVETVLIVKNHTTMGAWEIFSDDLLGHISVTLGSNTKLPLQLDLSGVKQVIDTAEGMAIVATSTPQADIWRWYLDGRQVVDASGPSLTLAPQFRLGSRHSLAVIAQKDGRSGSSGFLFRVEKDPQEESDTDTLRYHESKDCVVEFSTPVDDRPIGYVWKGPELGESILKPMSSLRTIIIKADDLTLPVGEAFNRLITFSKSYDIPITLGLITKYLESPSSADLTDIRTLVTSPLIEVWCHGYSHLIVSGKNEFYGLPLEEQRKSISRSIQLTEEKLGIKLETLGAPGNLTDANTLVALADFTQIKNVFFSPSDFIGYVFPSKYFAEHPTGELKTPSALLVNLESWRADEGPFVFQIHPKMWKEQHWSNFSDFVNIVKARGTTRFSTARDFADYQRGLQSLSVLKTGVASYVVRWPSQFTGNITIVRDATKVTYIPRR